MIVFPNSSAKMHPMDQISTDFVYIVEPINIYGALYGLEAT